MVSALAVEIGRDVGMDRAQLGVAFAAPFAVGALVAPLASRFVERVGPATGVRVAAGVICTALLLLAVAARTWWAVAAILAFAGIGTVTGQLAANLALAGAVRDGHQGLAFGAKEAAVPVAGLGAGLLLPLVALPVGWRYGFVVAAAVAAAGALARPRLGVKVTTRDDAAAWRPTRVVLAIAIAGLFAGAIGNSLSVFVVDSAVSRGLEQSEAALLLAAASVTTFAGRIGVGLLVDRRKSSGIGEYLVLMIAACGALALLSSSADTGVWYVLATLVAFGAGWGWPGVLYYAIARTNPAHVARATGFALSFVFVGTILGPIVIGAIAEHAGYSTAWLLGSLAFGFAAAATAIGRTMLTRNA